MKKSINSADAPKAEHILSQAIEFNGLVFVSGQIHSTPDGKLTQGSVRERLAQVRKLNNTRVAVKFVQMVKPVAKPKAVLAIARILK